MTSTFIAPDLTGTIPPSLWIPLTPPQQSLVSDWHSHVYEIVSPYMDVARGLTGMDDTVLAPLLSGLSAQDWSTFREWILKGLLNLVSPLFTNVPDLTGWYGLLLSNSDFKQALVQSIGSDPKSLPALSPPNPPIQRPYERELLELRAIVAGVTSSTVLRSISNAIPKSVPPVLFKDDQVAGLVTWLQIQIAKPYPQEIEKACNASQDFAVISTGLWKIVSTVVAKSKPANLPGVDTLLATYSKLGTATLAGILSKRAVGMTGTDPALTSTAPPLVIQVLPMRTSPKTLDPLNTIRGFGLLLRRASPAGSPPMKWRCPNIVAPILDQGQDGSQLPLLVAKRLGYSRSLMSGVLTYDNGPLICQTVLMDYLDVEHVSLQSTDPSISITDSIYRYRSFENAASSLYGTPMLECGVGNEALCFAISNCGALPVELRGGHPAKLKDLDSSNPSNPNGNFPYLRTVPISAAEVRDGQGRILVNKDGFFPAVPSDVYLRSAALSASSKITTLLLTPPTSLWETEARVVNASAATRSQFEFSLQLPSIEPQTWDRCAGYKIKDKKQRAQILNDAYSTLAKQKRGGGTEITEPLITSVTVIVADAGGTVLGSRQFAKSDFARPGSTVLTYPLKVAVDAGTGVDGASKKPKNDGKVQIGILTDSPSLADLATGLKEGQIYQLSVQYTLEQDIDSIMPRYCKDPQLCDGFDLLIEIASATLPTIDDLIQATDVKANFSPNRNVSAQLPVSAKHWDSIHRVDFLRQTWYWTGRTQPSQVVGNVHDFDPGYFPAGEKLDSDKTRRWETVEFAERPWNDHVELLSTLKNGKFTWNQDMSLDSRANFFRFAPRVYSRYQGCFANFAPQGVSTVGNVGPDKWRTCFLSASSKNLALPRLKTLIPIIESAFSDGTPGILAVFDGASFDQAGLAERMTVSVAAVNDPDPSVKSKWAEAGPDFLMSSEKVTGDPDQQIQMDLVACGPIGHTFDDPNSYFPKFTSSSWIVRPKNKGDFGWWFANLKFTLALDGDSAVASSVNVASEPSVGSWVQFLPGFQSDGHQFNELMRWSLNWDKTKISLWDEKNQQAQMPANKNELHVEHYLLVTRRVIDITGTSREAYFGVARPDGKSWSFLGNTTASDTVQLRCRFMDIRAGIIGMAGNTAPSDDRAFWTRVFGSGNINDETRSSIISLSPVISKRRGAE